MGRMAGEPMAAMVDRFMAMEPMPEGVSIPEWIAEQQKVRNAIIDLLTDGIKGGSDPRDYKTEPGLWRSQLLPLGVTIDQAIKDGVW